MPKNMGGVDRIVRLAVALALVLMAATGFLRGGWLVVGIVVAAVFAVTSLLGFCPLYVPLRISTRRK